MTTPNTSPAGSPEAACHAERAARVIEGEHYAKTYLDRMAAGMVQPGELAVLLAYLRGEVLHGACRLIEKALEGRNHG